MPTTPESYADANNRQRKLLTIYAMNQELGRTPKNRLVNALGRTGIGGADLETLSGQVGRADIEQRLENLARTGAEGAAVAKKRTAELAKGDSLSDLEQFGASAKADVQDQLAGGSERLRQQLMASLGGPVDPSSGALMAAIGQFESGRQDELFRGMRAVDQSILGAREANRQTYDLGAISQALEQIGTVVEMRKLAREQEKLARASQIGRIAGGLLGPGLGTAVGGAFGGTAGAAAGTDAGYQALGFWLNAATMFGSGGLGGGGGRGGSAVPQGDMASWHSAMFPQ